jgi:hypothetical protein
MMPSPTKANLIKIEGTRPFCCEAPFFIIIIILILITLVWGVQAG